MPENEPNQCKISHFGWKCTPTYFCAPISILIECLMQFFPYFKMLLWVWSQTGSLGMVTDAHANWVTDSNFFLAGAFQSDALLVPEHCLFDHIHNQTKCWDFDQWNRTASNACQERGMKVKSFAMLLPCGIDVFSGVEFVCCPFSKPENTNSKKGAGLVF